MRENTGRSGSILRHHHHPSPNIKAQPYRRVVRSPRLPHSVFIHDMHPWSPARNPPAAPQSNSLLPSPCGTLLASPRSRLADLPFRFLFIPPNHETRSFHPPGISAESISIFPLVRLLKHERLSRPPRFLPSSNTYPSRIPYFTPPCTQKHPIIRATNLGWVPC